MFKKKKGFTLAEVMVALTLIGVISVLTVPSLVTNTSVKKKVMAFKKANLTLNDAFVNANTYNSGFLNNSYNLLEAMSKYMGVKFYMDASNTIQATHGLNTNSNTAGTTSNWVITNDGIAYRFTQLTGNNGCVNNNNDRTRDVLHVNTATTTPTQAQACYSVLIDIDGPNKGEATNAQVSTDTGAANGKITAVTGDRFTVYISTDGVAAGHPTAGSNNAWTFPGAVILNAED